MIERDRRRWVAVSAVALTAAAAAALAPPEALLGSPLTRRPFAALVAAAIAAVAAVPAGLGRHVGRRALWVAVAAIALAAGAGAYVGFGALLRACTADYNGRAVIIGTTLNDTGAAYAAGNPGLTRDELLFDAAGSPERVWTRDSIDRCRATVGATYFLWLPCLAVCLLACWHAVPAGLLPVSAPRPSGPAAATGVPLPIMYDVFISYRHGGQDAEVARDLLAALERRGYRVAIDERDFPANASFLQEMERCIRQSRYTVAILSPRYLGSGHCEEEAIVCKVLDMGDRQRRLIPLIIESVALPAWLFGIVGIDCTRADPLVDPFDKLQATLGPPLSAALSSA